MKLTNTTSNGRKGRTGITSLFILFLLMALTAWAQESGKRPYPADYRPDAVPFAEVSA
ncbi:MAG: hypothetical protein U5N26_09100 [Candidatus Marinimicrobia bacterium]|nr:hypothetical protein [Candidatus Neomarinimicrobiota bacterium]